MQWRRGDTKPRHAGPMSRKSRHHDFQLWKLSSSWVSVAVLGAICQGCFVMSNSVLGVVASAFLVIAVVPTLAAPVLVPITCPLAADEAFKIEGARDEMDGVRSEYVWLREQRPGWVRSSQAHVRSGGHDYDLLMIDKGNDHQTICFDITDFFGHIPAWLQEKLPGSSPGAPPPSAK